MPIVSIIMSIHNCKNRQELERCMNSLKHQTLEDFECIIYDDGSTDESLNWIHEIVDCDSRFKVLHSSSNCGLAYGLNRCLEVATGDFIARQDADDQSSLDRLQKQVKYLRENEKIDFVGTFANLVDSEGKWGTLTTPELVAPAAFLWNSPFVHPTVMFRRSILHEVDGYRVEKITRRCEDYDLFMRLYAHGFRGATISTPLYDYQADRHALKNRAMKYRIDEMKVRYRGFKQLNILTISKFGYVIKPMILGLLPKPIYRWLWKSREGQRKGGA